MGQKCGDSDGGGALSVLDSATVNEIMRCGATRFYGTSPPDLRS
jgi:hypothetical protein